MDNDKEKKSENDPLNRDQEDKWLRLYDIVHGEEQHFSGEHHRRVNFFIGLALALIAATVGGLFQVKEAYQYLVLLLGPVATILISWIGMRASNDIYRRWLEAVTKKMKIEHLLQLDKPPETSRDSDPWWQKEPFVPSRYLRNRENVPSDITTDSAKWVEYYQIHGPYTGKMRWLSTIFIVAAAVLALFLVVQFAMAACKCVSHPREKCHAHFTHHHGIPASRDDLGKKSRKNESQKQKCHSKDETISGSFHSWNGLICSLQLRPIPPLKIVYEPEAIPGPTPRPMFSQSIGG